MIQLRYIQNKDEQAKILRACHVNPTAGHMGIKKTINRITEVFAYDSMFCHAPDQLQQQIAALLKTDEKAIDVKFCKVAMQTNGCDCGVYAIAYATALCLRTSPSKLIFDENAMRPHLVKCLQDGKFTMFPVRKRSRKGAMKATRKIPIYCVCRMPSVGGAAMIQCSNCQEWFHIHCVSPSPAAPNTTSEPWYCTADCD